MSDGQAIATSQDASQVGGSQAIALHVMRGGGEIGRRLGRSGKQWRIWRAGRSALAHRIAK